jgi:hypothetical protein
MTQEICVYQDIVRRHECCVVLEEERRGDLWSAEHSLAGEIGH